MAFKQPPLTPIPSDVQKDNPQLYQYLKRLEGVVLGIVGGVDAAQSSTTNVETSTLSALYGKADKVSGATAENLAALDAQGNLTDSGADTSDFAIAAKGVTNGDSHDHSGGDGAQIDHGGLAGLADDDHTQYALIDGTRAFSGVPSCAITPTTGDHLVNKTYADALAIASGSGDVTGPSSAVNNRIAVFSGTTGKVIADGGSLISDLAVAAKGVTNGDSHDHNGGDGGTIAHGSLSDVGTNTHAQIDTHVASTANPHSTTASQVGLGNCDNTSDADKPVSTAQQTALDGKISHSLATAANDVLVASGAGAFVKKTLAELKTILGLGTAAYTASTDYAVEAKGVTNGDTHDHSGGDGAQIAHGDLSSVGTNTHAVIDTFMAKATATPTAGAIPLADSSGKLNDWVDLSPMVTDDFWESDGSGDLMPALVPTLSDAWELDANGAIQPKAV